MEESSTALFASGFAHFQPPLLLHGRAHDALSVRQKWSRTGNGPIVCREIRDGSGFIRGPPPCGYSKRPEIEEAFVDRIASILPADEAIALFRLARLNVGDLSAQIAQAGSQPGRIVIYTSINDKKIHASGR